MMGGVRQDPSEMQTLKVADYEAILANKKYVSKVSPEVTTAGQVIYGANNTNTTVYGETPDYLDIRQWEIDEGDIFSDEDIQKSAKVCVVGQTIVKELFGEGANPIGEVIRFKSIPFRIVGTLKGKGYNTWGMDQDNLIHCPIHHGDETPSGSELSAINIGIGYRRGIFRPSHRRNIADSAREP